MRQNYNNVCINQFFSYRTLLYRCSSRTGTALSVNTLVKTAAESTTNTLDKSYKITYIPQVFNLPVNFPADLTRPAFHIPVQ